MRAPLTIVIPTLNAAPETARLLPQLMEGLEAGILRELILSDGGSEDDIAQLAEGIGATLIRGAPGRGGQLARGAQAAQSTWLLFLHADSQLPPGWPQIVMDHIKAPGRPAAFRLAFDATGLAAKLTAGWANLRSRAFGLPYGDQGLLISAKAYAAAGGHPDIPLMEDVALARALPKITLLNAEITTSAARYQQEGWLRRGSRNLLILGRYLLGASPQTLAKSYRPKA
ncbi:MAG: TIGR04283 family arsenosugar biosynthesis glycosyltransferase [Paracoccaceae bacterium]